MQAQACAWLGHWYNEVAQEYGKARNCYRQALALEPQSTVLGEACTPSIQSCFQNAHRKDMQ